MSLSRAMDTIGADQRGRLAQWLERLLHTQEVTGSSPVLPTIQPSLPVAQRGHSIADEARLLRCLEVIGHRRVSLYSAQQCLHHPRVELPPLLLLQFI